MNNFKSIQCVVSDIHTGFQSILTFVRNNDGLFTSRLGENKYLRDVFPRLPMSKNDLSSENFADLVITISKEYETLIQHDYDELIVIEQDEILFGCEGSDKSKQRNMIPLLGVTGERIPTLQGYVKKVAYNNTNPKIDNIITLIAETLDSDIQKALNNLSNEIKTAEDFISLYKNVMNAGNHYEYHKSILLINGEVILSEIENETFTTKQKQKEFNLVNNLGCTGLTFF